MVHAALAPSIGRDFDPFLFASIGQDRNGQTLSVISALARSDLDPWQEAVILSRMPAATATARLARIIAALPGEPRSGRPCDAVAGDLIALLPLGRGLVSPLPEKVAAAVGRPDARFWIGLVAVAVLMTIGLIASKSNPPETGRAALSGPPAPQGSSATVPPAARPVKASSSGPT